MLTHTQLLDLFTDVSSPPPTDNQGAAPAPPATPATRSSPTPPLAPEFPERDTPSPLALPPSPPLSPTPDTQRHNNAIETSALPTPKSAGFARMLTYADVCV
jgi:hypothetical protein